MVRFYRDYLFVVGVVFLFLNYDRTLFLLLPKKFGITRHDFAFIRHDENVVKMSAKDLNTFFKALDNVTMFKRDISQSQLFNKFIQFPNAVKRCYSLSSVMFDGFGMLIFINYYSM